jgi:hypothetical protein
MFARTLRDPEYLLPWFSPMAQDALRALETLITRLDDVERDLQEAREEHTRLDNLATQWSLEVDAAEARCERLEVAGHAVIQWWDSKLGKELARFKDFPWAEDAEWEEFNALRAALTEKDTEK